MMSDIVSIIPSHISVKDASRVLEIHPRTASRRTAALKTTLRLGKSDQLPVNHFCTYFNLNLSTVIRKLYPTLYLELRKEFTTSQLDQMF